MATIPLETDSTYLPLTPTCHLLGLLLTRGATKFLIAVAYIHFRNWTEVKGCVKDMGVHYYEPRLNTTDATLGTMYNHDGDLTGTFLFSPKWSHLFRIQDFFCQCLLLKQLLMSFGRTWTQTPIRCASTFVTGEVIIIFLFALMSCDVIFLLNYVFFFWPTRVNVVRWRNNFLDFERHVGLCHVQDVVHWWAFRSLLWLMLFLGSCTNPPLWWASTKDFTTFSVTGYNRFGKIFRGQVGNTTSYFLGGKFFFFFKIQSTLKNSDLNFSLLNEI